MVFLFPHPIFLDAVRANLYFFYDDNLLPLPENPQYPRPAPYNL